jgi:cytochrome subunit of sulfide dehydrogenase
MRSSISLIAMLAAAGSAAAQPFDPLQIRGWSAACTSCHASNASQGPADFDLPPLAGAGRESMVAALLDFKSGRRPATVMQQLARGYDDEQLQAIADHFSRLPPP